MEVTLLPMQGARQKQLTSKWKYQSSSGFCNVSYFTKFQELTRRSKFEKSHIIISFETKTPYYNYLMSLDMDTVLLMIKIQFLKMK